MTVCSLARNLDSSGGSKVKAFTAISSQFGYFISLIVLYGVGLEASTPLCDVYKPDSWNHAQAHSFLQVSSASISIEETYYIRHSVLALAVLHNS